VIDLLVRLGWDVETAQQAKLTGKIDDVIWVKYARKRKRISITFDELRAGQGARVAIELRKHSGKIIRVQGGPEQNEYRAVGKLLFHLPEWYPFFLSNNGVAIISDIRHNCRTYTPEQYQQKFYPTQAEQFTKYLKVRKRKVYRRRKRKSRTPPMEQPPLVS
jgi:hypothetical protein